MHTTDMAVPRGKAESPPSGRDVAVAWVTVVGWTVVGAVALLQTGSAASRINGHGGAGIQSEAAVASAAIRNAFPRALSDVFAVTVASPEPFTARAAGLAAVASTITSAALIMAVVFGYFAFSRVLIMQFIGLGLAVAVIIDATIVRIVLVPAIMDLAGRWNWWPGRR